MFNLRQWVFPEWISTKVWIPLIVRSTVSNMFLGKTTRLQKIYYCQMFNIDFSQIEKLLKLSISVEIASQLETYWKNFPYASSHIRSRNVPWIVRKTGGLESNRIVPNDDLAMNLRRQHSAFSQVTPSSPIVSQSVWSNSKNASSEVQRDKTIEIVNKKIYENAGKIQLLQLIFIVQRHK